DAIDYAIYDTKNDEFQNKIKNCGWKCFFNKHVHLLTRRNIVQRIKDTIHTEFPDLIKPKIKNRQVTCKEEQKFKDAKIIWECYTKLNKPIDANDNPQYTYLNLIINRTFADLDTEKNSIAFGMAVALNYLDLSKRINMVLTEVIDRINYILEKMQVSELEEL
ncbi:11843_t:CDS:2, partial [Racocetra persica]